MIPRFSCAPGREGFTLIELLVVISIIATLIGMLLPALSSSKLAANTVADLANMRSLETAHRVYLTDHRGVMLGTSHGVSWIDTLRDYDPSLLLRSPVDTSSHFQDDGGTPINGVYRHTSYAINFWLAPDNPTGFSNIVGIDHPSSTIHFVIKVFEGSNATADHVHPMLWWSPISHFIPSKAAAEVQTNAFGGSPSSWLAKSNYSMLDGHAESLRFNKTFTDNQKNKYDPKVAQ